MAYDIKHAELGRQCHEAQLRPEDLPEKQRKASYQKQLDQVERQLKDILPDTPLHEILSKRKRFLQSKV